MNITRPLLLTASPPGGQGVGQIYMHSLCGLLPPRSAVVAALLGQGERWSPPKDLQLVETVRLQRQYESVYRPLRGPIGEAAAVAGVRFRLEPHARRMVAEAAKSGRIAGVDAIAAVLESPTIMLMAARLADALSVPLFSLVWDVPEYVLSNFGHTAWSAKPLKRGFDDALRRSVRVAVMSDAMQRRFSDEYGSHCVILRQPIADEWTARRQVTARGPQDDLVIGFAGSVTAKDEMELLCRALDSVNWLLAGRRVRLRVFGLRYVCQAQTARWIEYRGYVPETADVVAGLSECDVLFLPQPFGAEGRPFAEFSFPTKFTTYLATQRPLLVLAPPYSALAGFCREHDLPVVCDQLQESAVLDHLQRLASDPDQVIDIDRRQQAVAETEFRPQRARERMTEWLSTDQAIAAPIRDRSSMCVTSEAVAND